MSDRALLPFELGGHQLFLETSHVREILGGVESVAVPQADRQLPGVFLWNSQAIPLLDMNECLGFSRDTSTKAPSARTIIAHVARETVGFGVEAVGEVVRVSDTDLSEVRVHSLPYARAEIEFADGIATLLDLPQLVAQVLHIAPVRAAVR